MVDEFEADTLELKIDRAKNPARIQQESRSIMETE